MPFALILAIALLVLLVVGGLRRRAEHPERPADPAREMFRPSEVVTQLPTEQAAGKAVADRSVDSRAAAGEVAAASAATAVSEVQPSEVGRPAAGEPTADSRLPAASLPRSWVKPSVLIFYRRSTSVLMER